MLRNHSTTLEHVVVFGVTGKPFVIETDYINSSWVHPKDASPSRRVGTSHLPEDKL